MEKTKSKVFIINPLLKAKNCIWWRLVGEFVCVCLGGGGVVVKSVKNVQYLENYQYYSLLGLFLGWRHKCQKCPDGENEEMAD